MDPITTAALGYLTKAFTDNKDAKEFKDDFFGGFVKWVRPLFLKDDPVAEAVLANDSSTEETKEAVIKAKLPKLMEDEGFREELAGWVEKLKANGIREKDVLRDAEIDVAGDVHIGDTNAKPENNKPYDRKNVVENTKVKGGSFRLGDDYKA